MLDELSKRGVRKERSLGEKLLKRLRDAYEIELEEFISAYIAITARDPFKVLVATILSQNSTDKAAMRAFKELDERVGVKPERLARANTKTIASSIRIAGLHVAKAKAIKRISKYLLEKYDGSFEKLLSGNSESVREVLLSLPQVGPKTADVVMVSLGITKTVPVDTHVERVVKRLGIVDEGATYEVMRSALDNLFAPEFRHEAHMLLITHGRRTCKAKGPSCEKCVINDLCSYYARKLT